jgi:hypothetical protein
MLWMPGAHNVVAVFKELQMKTDGVRRAATEAVVLFMVPPGVYDSF